MCAILVLAGCGEPDGEVAYDLAALVAEARVISGCFRNQVLVATA